MTESFQEIQDKIILEAKVDIKDPLRDLFVAIFVLLSESNKNPKEMHPEEILEKLVLDVAMRDILFCMYTITSITYLSLIIIDSTSISYQTRPNPELIYKTFIFWQVILALSIISSVRLYIFTKKVNKKILESAIGTGSLDVEKVYYGLRNPYARKILRGWVGAKRRDS